MQRTLRVAAHSLEIEFSYLPKIPHLFVHADNPDHVAECVRRLEQAKQLDPLSSYIKNERLGDLKASATDGIVSDWLSALIKRLANSPIDESPGEGFHRDMSNERRRAPGVKLHSTKASIRAGGNRLRFKRWLRTTRGRRVIDFEYAKFKRLLQVKHKGFYRNRKLPDKLFYKKVYCMDPDSFGQWNTTIVGNVSDERCRTPSFYSFTGCRSSRVFEDSVRAESLIFIFHTNL